MYAHYLHNIAQLFWAVTENACYEMHTHYSYKNTNIFFFLSYPIEVRGRLGGLSTGSAPLKHSKGPKETLLCWEWDLNLQPSGDKHRGLTCWTISEIEEISDIEEKCNIFKWHIRTCGKTFSQVFFLSSHTSDCTVQFIAYYEMVIEIWHLNTDMSAPEASVLCRLPPKRILLFPFWRK